MEVTQYFVMPQREMPYLLMLICEKKGLSYFMVLDPVKLEMVFNQWVLSVPV